MSTKSRARRACTALASVAGATMLALSACGATPADGDDGAPKAEIEASDGGSQGSDEGAGGAGESGEDAGTGDSGASDEAESSEGGAGTGEGEDTDEGGAAPDAGEDGNTGAAEGGTRILLVTDLSQGEPADGDPVLTAEDLAALLAGPLDGTAQCAGEMELSPGSTASCTGPGSTDDPDAEQEWTAHSVRVPSGEDLPASSASAVLFTTGGELTGPAETLVDEDTALTGLGFGAMFGSEDLSPEELSERVLQVLTSENAYVPVGDVGWEGVDCPNGLSFDSFAPVACTATTTAGESWDLQVAPGAFADSDRGLLVGIVNSRG